MQDAWHPQDDELPGKACAMLMRWTPAMSGRVDNSLADGIGAEIPAVRKSVVSFLENLGVQWGA